MKPATKDRIVDWRTLGQAYRKGVASLNEWCGVRDGICVKYACGLCSNQACTAEHRKHSECPKGWVDATKETLRRGVDKLQEGAAAQGGGGARC